LLQSINTSQNFNALTLSFRKATNMETLERIPNAIAVPPIPTLRAMMVRTPLDKDDLGYKADCEFFRQNPHRSQAIRRGASEFMEVVVAVSENPPPYLSVLVIQSAPGYHVILPLWRGVTPWKEESVAGVQYAIAPNDGALHVFVAQCISERGMCFDALVDYQQHMENARKAGESIQAMAKLQDGKVH
jgi:hypothetical protein